MSSRSSGNKIATYHLDDIVLPCRPGQAHFALWMPEFACTSVLPFSLAIYVVNSPKAVAVMYTGILVLKPNISVEKSTFPTFRRILGLNHTLIVSIS